MPPRPQSTVHLSDEPTIFLITVQGIVYSYSYLCGIYGSLQVSIDVTSLVGFRKQVVEVPHRQTVVLCPKIRIAVIATAHIVDLAVRNQQAWYLFCISLR